MVSLEMMLWMADPLHTEMILSILKTSEMVAVILIRSIQFCNLQNNENKIPTLVVPEFLIFFLFGQIL